MTPDAPSNPCERLSVSARRTFEAFAIGLPRRPSSSTVRELLAAGLIEPTGTQSWEVTIPAHIAWCEWCSAQEKAHV
jgi:hypothetical protein